MAVAGTGSNDGNTEQADMFVAPPAVSVQIARQWRGSICAIRAICQIRGSNCSGRKKGYPACQVERQRILSHQRLKGNKTAFFALLRVELSLMSKGLMAILLAHNPCCGTKVPAKNPDKSFTHIRPPRKNPASRQGLSAIKLQQAGAVREAGFVRLEPTAANAPNPTATNKP